MEISGQKLVAELVKSNLFQALKLLILLTVAWSRLRKSKISSMIVGITLCHSTLEWRCCWSPTELHKGQKRPIGSAGPAVKTFRLVDR